jgi:hypothetical protein
MSTTPSLPLRRLFQSYANADHVDAQSLMGRLKPNFDASTALRFEIWSDRQILLGASWDQAIKEALAQADAGLLLLSPKALASGYIQRTEIPALLAAAKLLLVGLRPVDFRTQLPPALQALQVFRLKTATGDNLFYTECRTGPQKDAFAHELYKALCVRLAATATPTAGNNP